MIRFQRLEAGKVRFESNQINLSQSFTSTECFLRSFHKTTHYFDTWSVFDKKSPACGLWCEGGVAPWWSDLLNFKMMSTKRFTACLLRRRACFKAQNNLQHVSSSSSASSTPEVSSLTALLKSHMPANNKRPESPGTSATWRPDAAKSLEHTKAMIQQDIAGGWERGRHPEILAAFSKARWFHYCLGSIEFLLRYRFRNMLLSDCYLS